MIEIETHQVIGIGMAIWVVGQIAVDARNDRRKRKQAKSKALERHFQAMLAMSTTPTAQEEEPEDAVLLLAGIGATREQQYSTRGEVAQSIAPVMLPQNPAPIVVSQERTGLTIEFGRDDILQSTAHAEARIEKQKRIREQQKKNYLK